MDYSDLIHVKAAARYQRNYDAEAALDDLHQQLALSDEYDPADPDNLSEAVGEFLPSHWAQIGVLITASWNNQGSSAAENDALAKIGRLVRKFSEDYQDQRAQDAACAALAKHKEV